MTDLEDRLAELAWEWLSDRMYRLDVLAGGEIYVLPDDETYEKVAGDDFNRLIIQRKSDGVLFEVELDATVFQVEVPDGQDGHPAVEGLPDVQES